MYVVDVFETVHYNHSRFFFVFSHLVCCHVPGAWYAVVEIVGVCRSDVRNVFSCLCPCRGISGVGVHDASYFGEGTIEHEVSRSVRRRIKIAFHHFARVQVNHHHVRRLHVVVWYTRRLDYHETFLAVDARDVAPGENHEIVFHEVEVGTEYFFFQFF